MDKEELAEEIAHHQKMLRVLRRRLREREFQEVQYGIAVPPEITSDIHELTERIQRHEVQLTQLQTFSVEDQFPLAEVEYRALLAEAWDTPRGRPTVAVASRLELARLRLGISPELAAEIEGLVRGDLAEETIYNLDIHLLRSTYVENKNYNSEVELKALLSAIGRAIRFDIHTTLIYTLSYIYEGERFKDSFVKDLLSVNKINEHSKDYETFGRFLVCIAGYVDYTTSNPPKIIVDSLERLNDEKLKEFARHQT